MSWQFNQFLSPFQHLRLSGTDLNTLFCSLSNYRDLKEDVVEANIDREIKIEQDIYDILKVECQRYEEELRMTEMFHKPVEFVISDLKRTKLEMDRKTRNIKKLNDAKKSQLQGLMARKENDEVAKYERKEKAYKEADDVVQKHANAFVSCLMGGIANQSPVGTNEGDTFIEPGIMQPVHVIKVKDYGTQCPEFNERSEHEHVTEDDAQWDNIVTISTASQTDVELYEECSNTEIISNTTVKVLDDMMELFL
jgi:hypothetical protein